MGERYLIDSNIVIGYLDRKMPPNGMQLIDTMDIGELNVSVITQIEVLRFNAPEYIYKTLHDLYPVAMCFN